MFFASTFLLVVVITGLVGFGQLGGLSPEPSQTLFFIFLVAFVAAAVMRAGGSDGGSDDSR